MSGSILEYRGQEAYWAALCAMEGIQVNEELPSMDDAETELAGVWEFVEGCCLEFDIAVPSRDEAVGHLRVLLAEYLEDMA
jgi:hypothetical protein